MQISIVGLGHIGGSLADGLKSESELSVYDSDVSVRIDATSSGMEVAQDMADLSQSDVVIFAVPTSKLLESVTTFLSFRRSVGSDTPALVVDLASVKAGITEEISWAIGGDPTVSYLSLHPMAGREGSGFGSRDQTIFQGSTWAEVATGGGFIAELVGEFLALLSARFELRLLPLSSAVHDASVALTSHLPHLIALALKGQLRSVSTSAAAQELVAGSFLGATRVANSNRDRIYEMCFPNRSALVDSLNDFVESLRTAGGFLADSDPDGLLDWIESCQIEADRPGDPRLVESATGGTQIFPTQLLKTELDRWRDSGHYLSEISYSRDRISAYVHGVTDE